MQNRFREVSPALAMLPVQLDELMVRRAMAAGRESGKWVLVFIIGTKPCFYKFYGSMMEAEKRGIPYIVVNSNQHYDAVLTAGEKELGYDSRTAVHLGLRGGLAEKSAELFIKISWLAKYLADAYPGVTALPVVLGDTLLCAMVPPAWMFTRGEKAIHNEAGLRAMSPVAMRRVPAIAPAEFIAAQFDGPWEIRYEEPFPEQYDTFVASRAAEVMFVPLAINRDHLIREGYDPARIFITGGVVVEALARQLAAKPERSLFDIHPVLAEGQWIRVDIHRKENQVRERIGAVVDCLRRLVEAGHRVCFIEMNTTRESIARYGLGPVLEELRRQPNFLMTGVWPEFAHVLEFCNSEHLHCALTDSGGVQEEMNILGKPCFTVRFSTDRPETVNDAHSNLLVPPVSGRFMHELLEHAFSRPELLEHMRRAPRLYGKNVAAKFMDGLELLMREKRPVFSWAHDALGIKLGDS